MFTATAQVPARTSEEKRKVPPQAAAYHSKAGRRPRPSHLYRVSRIYAKNNEATPIGLENLANRIPGQGHSYRNAVIQILMSTPIFLELADSHHKRRVGDDGQITECIVNQKHGADRCLLCAFCQLAHAYWDFSFSAAVLTDGTERLRRFWNICTSTFWTSDKSKTTSAGEIDPDEEHCCDAFLLHLLNAIQLQLTVIPHDLKTFEQIFTTQVDYEWKCNIHPFSEHFKTIAHLHLPIYVTPATARERTTVVNGLRSGMMKIAELEGKRARRDRVLQPTCPQCGAAMTMSANIMNYPEIMLATVQDDCSDLQGNKLPPGYLDFCSGQSEEASFEFADNGPDPIHTYVEKLRTQSMVDYMTNHKKFGLIGGVGEIRKTGVNTGRGMAFVKGPSGNLHDWYMIEDTSIQRLSNLRHLADTQQIKAASGKVYPETFRSELLVYRREDPGQWSRHHGTPSYLLSKATDPNFDERQKEYDLMARGTTEVFTHKIGTGLLKFKIKMCPTDPQPNDNVPFSIELGYEYNNNQWHQRLDATLRSQSQWQEKELTRPLETPWEDDVYYRFVNKKAGANESGEPNVNGAKASAGDESCGFAPELSETVNIDPS